MRKVLIVLCLVLLCGCQSVDKKLEKLGYSDKQIELIKYLDEDTINLFLDTYQEKYVAFMELDGFRLENLNKYASLYGKLDNQMIIDLVNKGVNLDGDVEKLAKLYSNEYYIPSNEELYLTYINDYDDVRDLIEIVNTKRYYPLYTHIEQSDVSKDYLLLVNKYYQLPSDYEPNDLVDIDPMYGRGQTREAVYEAYKLLYEDAYALGYDLTIVSAYRSFDYQDGLYNKYLQTDSQENVDTYSARPGHSEHQSALCLDVTIPGYSLESFYLHPAADWLRDNCYKYGFIIRYTLEKQDITGYESEPWQIRYVGLDAAKDIYERGITFDEYYACFIDK